MILNGYLIKKERINKKMKQIWLAKGICSVSYLSKIENGQTAASQEILSLLEERLEIVTDSFDPHTEDSIIKSLSNSYKEYLTKKIKDGIHVFANTRDKKYVFNCRRNHNTYNLLLIRFLLINNEDRNTIRKEIEFSQLLLSEYSNKEKYLYYINGCLYRYFESDYQSAFDYILKTEDILNGLLLEPWERADFNYIASLCYGKRSLFNQAIDLAGQSLKYFTDNIYSERALDCHIILGNSYKNLSDYNNSKKHLMFALEITNQLNKYDHLGMIYHNLALLHSRMGFSLTAIEKFKKSLEYKRDEGHKSYLLTLYALMKELYKNSDYEEASELCKQGSLLINEWENNELYKEYTFHFDIYRNYFDESVDIEKTLISAIDYFGTVNDNWNTTKYTLALAEHYKSIGQYKKSAINYSKFVQVQLEKKSIKSWEEL
ncbi:helix-turn-helix domain-containing protein [Sporosarcina siberiensis]|uniref:Helix-turn-helix domain-containing protein n=1 Tax=Sporosarcina siberiensis TaxID=1365606 RepID=A0ABW4SAY1_9BACL